MAMVEESRGGGKRWSLLSLISTTLLLFLLLGSSFLIHYLGPITPSTFISALQASYDSHQDHSQRMDQSPVDEEDPKCLSRTQQRLLRRAPVPIPVAVGANASASADNPSLKLFLPSSRFLEAWDHYGEHHRRCTTGRNFTQDVSSFLHHHARPNAGGNLSNSSEGIEPEEEEEQEEECKFLIFLEGSGGLGNRLLSLASAFAYSLLTNRSLLIVPGAVLPSLLCEPFPQSSWLLPEVLVPAIQDALRTSLPLGDYLARTEISNRSLVLLNLEHVSSGSDQQFFCEDAQRKLLPHKWVAWQSNQYYLPQLFMIPSFWPSMCAFFPDPTQAFLHLGRRLILPTNDIWGIIVREYWSYMAGSGEKLGLQIRPHGHPDLAGFYNEIEDRVWRCLVNHNLLPRTIEQENKTELEVISRKKTRQKAGGAEGGVDITVFVASLQAKYAEALQDRYSSKPAMDALGHYATVRVHTASHYGRQDNGIQQARHALAEMWLLSFVDHLAISAYSTFGYTAQGLSGMPSLLLHINKGVLDDPVCSIEQSAEPCCHFAKWPTCVAENLLGEHREWVRTHIRHCQDYKVGIQLVNMREREGTNWGDELFFFKNHV